MNTPPTVAHAQSAAVVSITHKLYDWLDSQWPHTDSVEADATWIGGARVIIADVEYNIDLLNFHLRNPLPDINVKMANEFISLLHSVADDGAEFAMLVLRNGE